jgi:hypothetical protein
MRLAALFERGASMTLPDRTESIGRLRSTFEAAMAFGLTDEEVWQAAVEIAARTPDSKPAIECIDEVADELA